MKHVIIGTGPAGVLAAETLRKVDPDSGITLIGDEPGVPYSRMAIPYYLQDRIGEEGTHLRTTDDHYKSLKIDLIRARVMKVNPGKNEITLDNGKTIGYDRLLVATGSRAYREEVLEKTGSPRVHACWTLEDARHIAKLAGAGEEVLLVGAGFVACIIMSALARRGAKVTSIVRGQQMVRSMMNPTASAMVKRWWEKEGIRVLTGTTIADAKCDAAGKLEVTFNSGNRMKPNLAVVATGVQPNIEFLEGSGIATDGGILVDEYLRTSIPNIYAAGDVAQGYDFSTGEQSVHIIQPTAVDHGRAAALNMAGRTCKFQGSLLMNVLDTMGLISGSFGRWQGIDGGDSAELIDEDNFRYINLQFDEDRLIGALTLGHTENIGVIRGLIQTKVSLGPWKQKLVEDPSQFMKAYLGSTQAIGHNAGVM
ncbi:MAG: pyridine nucleotide-disulfide oxidoreductase [Gammaproteobacteria bacterium RBG_16_51_14]|nr:MAG: pyridine nucleotide-disulfide oxidoreductase [Gammaproteobacteria bacterium RBG_16_51_14]